jgi:hypothetical protein
MIKLHQRNNFHVSLWVRTTIISLQTVNVYFYPPKFISKKLQRKEQSWLKFTYQKHSSSRVICLEPDLQESKGSIGLKMVCRKQKLKQQRCLCWFRKRKISSSRIFRIGSSSLTRSKTSNTRVVLSYFTRIKIQATESTKVDWQEVKVQEWELVRCCL